MKNRLIALIAAHSWKDRLIGFIAARCRGEHLLALITIHSPGDHLLAFTTARSPEERLDAPVAVRSSEEHLHAPVTARSVEERLHTFIAARLLDVRLHILTAAHSLEERLHAFIAARLLEARLHASVAARSLGDYLLAFILALSRKACILAFVAARSLEERLHALLAARSRKERLLVFVAAHSREDRFLALIAALSLAVGLVHGVLAAALLAAFSAAPHNVVVHLDRPAQDDFIIAVAEAYAGDHDLPLARDRLARLHSMNTAARVENLARDYAIQYDLVASQLSGLAVALGSRNTILVALSIVPQPTLASQNSAKTGVPTPTPTQSLGAPLLPLPEDGPVTSTAAQWLGAPLLPLPEDGPVNLIPAQWLGAPLLPLPEGESAAAATQKPAGGQAQPPAPIPVLASNAKPDTSQQAGSGSSPVVRRVSLSFPDYVGAPSLSIPLNAPPSGCTPASQLPAVVDRTMALCPNQVYPPFRVKGNNITIYGDPGGTARIYARGRGFGITVNGNNITITGVHIEAETDQADLKTWLCLYENCGFKTGPVHGGIGYGGGILLDNTTNATVVSSTVSKGTIGVAVLRGSNNKIAKSNLSNLNGWGALLLFTKGNALVGNTLNHVTRDCVAPDGDYIQAGCESAGIAAIQAEANLFVDNHCEHSSNCIYASGEGGYGSNDNKFFNNYCAASPNNCFEVTFSSGNRFDYNVATSDPDTGDKCIYPFWIGGSTVDFGPHNAWNCKFSAEQAFKDSKAGTNVSTAMRGF